MGIERRENWIRFPKANEVVDVGNRPILYGLFNVLNELLKK